MGKILVARGRRCIGLDGSTTKYYSGFNIMTSNRKNSNKKYIVDPETAETEAEMIVREDDNYFYIDKGHKWKKN